MREVAERVPILGDLGRRRDVEPECDALLIGRVDWSEPHVVVRMRGRLFVNVSSDVFDAESHAHQSPKTIAVHRHSLNDGFCTGAARRFHAAGSSCFRYKFRRRFSALKKRREKYDSEQSSDRQPRRDRNSHHPRGRRDGHPHRGRFPGRRFQFAAHAKGRRGPPSERRGRGRVPRRRTDYCARQRGGLRRDPSRLRLSQRERRLRAAMRHRGNHVRRTARRDTRTLRRQGAGASAGRAMRRADPARHLGRDEPR